MIHTLECDMTCSVQIFNSDQYFSFIILCLHHLVGFIRIHVSLSYILLKFSVKYLAVLPTGGRIIYLINVCAMAYASVKLARVGEVKMTCLNWYFCFKMPL